MLFRSRVFHVAKDTEYANEYEDAFCVDESRGIAAAADGVSSAVFSGKWARILTQAIVESPPCSADGESFQEWLARRRADWFGQIDFAKLPYNLKAKLRQAGGAFSTLLWVEVVPMLPEGEREQFRFHGRALGDSCLLHVRGGEILTTFPLKTAAEFEADPISICSVNLNRDEMLQLQEIEGVCEAGDCLVLCTDALAKWAIARLENGRQADWDSYWTMDETSWVQEIAALRDAREMRRDDTTLVLLRVGDSVVADEPAESCGPAATDSQTSEPPRPSEPDEPISPVSAAPLVLARSTPTAIEETCESEREQALAETQHPDEVADSEAGSAALPTESGVSNEECLPEA